MRILEDESLAQQARVVIERRAVEQPKAARIDEDFRAVRTDVDLIGRPGIRIPRKRVFEARASAGLDADAQRALAKLRNLLRRGFGDGDLDAESPPPNGLRNCTGVATPPAGLPPAISASVQLSSAPTMRSFNRQSGSRTLHFEY